MRGNAQKYEWFGGVPEWGANLVEKQEAEYELYGNAGGRDESGGVGRYGAGVAPGLGV